MSIIDDLLERYRAMDPVQRQNFWYAVVGLVLILFLLMSLGDTFDSLSGFLSRGAQNVTNGTV